MSAVRNLNGADVGGRPLRIDLADSDPFLEGKTTVRGELIDSGGPDNKWQKDYHEDRRQGSSSSGPAFLANLPPGVQVPPGSTALDTISQSLATMEPSQLIEVLAQMKVCPKRTFHASRETSRIMLRPDLRLCSLLTV
jgi:cleavage stimulation factor subunit 2